MIYPTRRQLAAIGLALAVTVSAAHAAEDDAVIGVTGAAGQLGGLVVDELLARIPAERIVAIARTPDERSDALAAKGVTVRFADYDAPDAVQAALEGVDHLLLVSSGGANRVAQHSNVIEAAKAQGVRFMAYTSFLHATTSPMSIRNDHVATEELLAASGLNHAVLRNSIYAENLARDTASALQAGEIAGAYGDGRLAHATRRDLAAASAVVLIDPDLQTNQIYELASDDSFTMEELAAEISRQSGRQIAYRGLTEDEARAELIARGMSEAAANGALAQQTAIAQGALFDDSRTISRLTGRPTAPWQEVVAQGVRDAAQASQ